MFALCSPHIIIWDHSLLRLGSELSGKVSIIIVSKWTLIILCNQSHEKKMNYYTVSSVVLTLPLWNYSVSITVELPGSSCSSLIWPAQMENTSDISFSLVHHMKILPLFVQLFRGSTIRSGLDSVGELRESNHATWPSTEKRSGKEDPPIPSRFGVVLWYWSWCRQTKASYRNIILPSMHWTMLNSVQTKLCPIIYSQWCTSFNWHAMHRVPNRQQYLLSLVVWTSSERRTNQAW